MPGSRDILADLVAFDTVSRESNLALIDYVRDYLAGFGVDSELFFDADGRKANLYATIGPSDRGGVCLSGHTDVVPADGQAWSVPPFRLSERDGRLYGRGTADMKGYLACVLAAVPAFLAAPLRLPVHLAFSYDEEVGCLGVRSLLAALERRPHKPLLCIIGEPTELKPVLGHKGKLAMRCEVHGAACHSAYAPQGVNAIEYAARLIGRLGEIGARLAVPERHDRRFDPPYSTVQTGLIQGGRALNIVPAECRFDFEVRALPADDPAAGRRGTPRLCRKRTAAADARGGAKYRYPLHAAIGLSRPAHRRRQPGGGADRPAQRFDGFLHRGLRHRGRAVPPGRYPGGDLRSRQHGPGPQAGRVRQPRSARGVRCPAGAPGGVAAGALSGSTARSWLGLAAKRAR